MKSLTTTSRPYTFTWTTHREVQCLPMYSNNRTFFKVCKSHAVRVSRCACLTIVKGQQNNNNNNNNNNQSNNYGGPPRGGFTDLQRVVYNAFLEAQDDQGLSVSIVAQRLRSKYSEAQVREAVVFLNGEGHLFSTIDEEHYKGTNWLWLGDGGLVYIKVSEIRGILFLISFVREIQ